MRRSAIEFLHEWKNRKGRKPLVIKGARQVGKTWLMKSFGSNSFENIAYINFESQVNLQSLFLEDFNLSRIMRAIAIASGVNPVAGKTLIIFDEIQAAERGVTVLKYFCEELPEFHVIAAGSLLGISLHKNTSFPVGKVEFLQLHPLSFTEFLHALSEQQLLELLNEKDWKLIAVFKNRFIERLKQYYFVGGMPEVVQAFSETNDYAQIRAIQLNILQSYENDFSKHAPYGIVPRIRMIWNNIPSQLAKENKKFIYGLLKEGSRAKEYESALLWLEDAGLVHKIYNITQAAIPLKSYESHKSFKLFVFDVGLLSAMNKIDHSVLLESNRFFKEFKGALTEQFVLQQLVIHTSLQINYWSSERSEGEVDFVIQNSQTIIPIEVKAEENLKAKSLKVFCDKYNVKGIRVSMSDFRAESWMKNVPLYALDLLATDARNSL